MSCPEKIEEGYDSESDVNGHWFLGCCDMATVVSLKVPRGCVWGLPSGVAPPRQLRASFLPGGPRTDPE